MDKWLTKNEIIEKFWNSKELEQKMDICLFRFGVGRQTNILQDCRAATFLELSKMDKNKIETLYNGVMYKTFEGYILNMFKMVSIYTSKGNHKSSIVSSIKHNSSFLTDSYVDAVENYNDVSDDYGAKTVIAKEHGIDYISQNELFNDIENQLTEEEIETLNLLLDKKKTKGRFKKDIAEKIKELKEDIKYYASLKDGSLNIKKDWKKDYKTDEEIEQLKQDIENGK